MDQVSLLFSFLTIKKLKNSKKYDASRWVVQACMCLSSEPSRRSPIFNFFWLILSILDTGLSIPFNQKIIFCKIDLKSLWYICLLYIKYKYLKCNFEYVNCVYWNIFLFSDIIIREYVKLYNEIIWFEK